MNEVFIRLLYGAMIAGGILMIAVGIAKADNGTPSSFWKPSDGWQREHAKPRHIHRHRPHRHKSTRVKAWRVVKPALPNGCFGPIEAIGEQWATTSGAKGKAEKAWVERVRFEYGEATADLSNAQDVQFACVTSNVPNAMTRFLDRVKEATGNSDTGWMHRCQISAIACRVRLQTEGQK